MKYIILRRTTLNDVVIEDGRFISTAPDYQQANDIALILKDDLKQAHHSLVGFNFDFYVRTYN